MKKSFKLKFMIMRNVSSFLLVIAFIGTICNVHTFAGANQNEIVNKASVSDFTNGYKLSGKSLFTFIPHADFGDTSISHFNNALYQWNACLPTGVSGMNRSPTSRHTDTTYPRQDNINRIYRVANFSKTYVAQTTSWLNKSSKIRIEADINLNMRYKWSNGASSDTYDVWTVFLHEAGHVMGLRDLADIDYINRVMYYASTLGEKKRSVTSEERTLIQQIYG